MEHYAGIDVSLELSSVCVMDATGRIVREAKVASEPEALVAWFRRLGVQVARATRSATVRTAGSGVAVTQTAPPRWNTLPSGTALPL